MIIDQLEGDTASISRLALANKKFNRLTKKTLYRDISVGRRVSSSGLIYLVCTLLQHPEYASLIKNLWVACYFADTRGVVPGPGSHYPRHRFGRIANDAFDRLDSGNYAFLNNCLRKIDSWVPDERGVDLLVAMRWKAAVLQHQSPAFASLLLAMCPSLEELSFHINYTEGDGRRLSLPCMFGFAAVDEFVEAESCFSKANLPLFLRSGLHMPEVQYLKIDIANNVDMLRLGFKKLVTLDVCLYVCHDNRSWYGSTHINPGQVSIPGVKNLVFRVDYEELVPLAGEQISRFVRHVELPQLTSLTIVLERSPRKHRNFVHAQVTFERLISQLKDQSAQNLLNNLEEFKVLITDNTTAFDKEFLHRFQPCTSLAWLPRLKKLTIPWQALSSRLPDWMVGSAEALPMADLPPSLEVLRILYPHAQTPLQLARLYPSAMGQSNLLLQEVEILFDKHWGMLDGGLRPLWQRVLDGLPAKVTLGWMPSVKDEIKALTASSSK